MSEALDALRDVESAMARLRDVLERAEAPPLEPPVPAEPAAPQQLLTLQDLKDGAARLKVPLVTVQAVDETESGRDGGFDGQGRCTVLFEPHVFSRETSHRFDATHGGVSYRKWKTRPYPTGTEDERNAANWAKIEYAAKLPGAREAAYRSASYGRFQVMGFNHQVCGFATVDAFVEAMQRSERDHLMAFITYVEKNNLARHLRSGDWTAFAAGYNGEGQAEAYGRKIAAAVARRS